AAYEPIILPGESISKYRGRRAGASSEPPSRSVSAEADPSVAHAFPEDEPIFTQPGHETEETQDFPPPVAEPEISHRSVAAEAVTDQGRTALVPEVGSDAWEQEQKRLHDLNVAAVFGGEPEIEEGEKNEQAEEQIAIHSGTTPLHSAGLGKLEHQEIDE